MINIFIQYLLGPVGRGIEALYLNNGLFFSLLLIPWLIIIVFGLHGVSHMRSQLRSWVAEILPNYDLDQHTTPERMLLALEPRWNEAAARVRFMPTKYGFWTQRATADGLRTHAGFTPEGIDQVITRITGRKRDTNLIAVDAAVKNARKHKRARAYSR